MEKLTAELEAIKEKLPDEELIYEMSDLYKVFSDSTRVKILCVLLESELSVGDIGKLLEMNQSAISHQLRLLKQAKMVKFRRDGKTIVYSIADNHIGQIFNQALEHIQE
ncbi:MAG: metalloregulator ArsR/SmtB family transcription factor [Ruminococcus sp.]|jgi:ArsR family transcriptional regulator|nr:metalloregulator ArsR/SmtB family transcription factor [Ruminococcus sp.]